MPPSVGGAAGAASHAAWQEGDPVGGRSFVRLQAPLVLESGELLPGVRMAYETWGTLNADASNAVLVLHALTGDSHLTGPAGPGHPTPGWWPELVGPGRALDTDQVFVVAPNVLGGCQGSTGPASPAPDGRPWGSRLPGLTIRDQVSAEVALADALGITRWAMVVGGSMGGMRALEWAVTFPSRVHGLFVLAAGAAASAEQIAWCSAQLAAIEADPEWHGGDYLAHGANPAAGLGVARQIAHVSYRSEGELQARFGNAAQPGEAGQDGLPKPGGRYAVQSYLDHQADKLVARFDAGSYAVLTRAMNSHDVGRGRGGLAAALGRVRADTLVAGIDTDRLYPLHQQRTIAELIPDARLRVVSHPAGHDGFLLASGEVGELLREQLAGLV